MVMLDTHKHTHTPLYAILFLISDAVVITMNIIATLHLTSQEHLGGILRLGWL
jgi:uncharacterized membrane protein YwaF